MFLTDPTILLVDDDRDDLEILNVAFNANRLKLNIIEACNGIEALDQLARLNEAGLVPSLIVLDINMPGMDGKETLTAIQANESFNSIPVVVLSTSSNEQDKSYFAKRGVDLITKPINFGELSGLALKLLAYCKNEDFHSNRTYPYPFRKIINL